MILDDSRITLVDAVRQVADARGIPTAHVALAWVLENPGVTALIARATKPHHLPDATAALGIHLTGEEIRTLEEPYTPHPPTGFRWARPVRVTVGRLRSRRDENRRP